MLNTQCCRKCQLEQLQKEIEDSDGWIQTQLVDSREVLKLALRFCSVCQKPNCPKAEDHNNSCE